MIFGTPNSQAKLGRQKFTLVGETQKGCEASQDFEIEVIGDPLVSQSWHLENLGQKAYSWFGATPGNDLNMHFANRLGLTGKGVHVRVSGTGMQIDHPDLVDNVNKDLCVNIEAKNPQGCAVCDPQDTTPFLEEGSIGDQGTAVAGIIAAKGWNGIGSRGIAPNAMLSAINITSPRMRREYITIEEQLNGSFDIMNQSWSKSYLSQETFEPLPAGYFELQKIKVTRGREKKGSLIIKAAGDQHFDRADANLDQFNALPWQIVVGSLDSKGVKSFRANTGSPIWISAPGGEAGYQGDYTMLKDKGYLRHMFQPAILSTDLFYEKSPCTVGFSKNASQFLERNNETKPSYHMQGETSGFNMGWNRKDNPLCAYTATVNGTAAATAMVSGAVALLLERNPELSWRDVKHILANTARKVDENFAERYTTLGEQRVVNVLPWIRNAAGYLFHNWYGFGALDVSESLKMADPKQYTSLPELYDSDWLPVFGGGGTITGQKPRGLEKQYTSRSKKTVETVSVKMDVSITRLAKLGAELISPSGTRSMMLSLNNGSFAADARELILTSNAFYGEDMAGRWTLNLLSNINDEEGTASLNSWSIRFTGH
jgi:subtilisin family serine protease